MAVQTPIIASLLTNIDESATAIFTANETSFEECLDRNPFRIAGVTIGIIDIFVGSIGNLLTILAIAGNKKLHKPFHIFIANLCVIDFLTASTMMPFNVTSYYKQTWPFGEDDFTCTFMAFSYYCCGYSSIVCLLVITVNRFVGVVYPDDYCRLFTKRRIIFIIFISWIFAPAALTPVFFFCDGGFGWHSELTLCVFKIQCFNSAQNYYMLFLRILFQFTPLIIMVILYSLIFLTSRQSRKIVGTISSKNQTKATVVESKESKSSAKFGSALGRTFPALGRTYSDAPAYRQSPLLNKKLLEKICHKSKGPNADLCEDHLDDKDECCQNGDTKHFQCTVTSPTVAEYQCKTNHVTTSLLSSNKDAELTFDNTHLSPKYNSQENIKLEEDSNDSDSSAGRMPPISKMKLKLGVSVSVPVTPALGVRKPIIYRPVSVADSIKSTTKLSHQHEKAFRDSHSMQQSTLQASPALSRCSSRSKYASIIRLAEKKRKNVDRRLLRISVTICAVFMILFLPSVFVNIMGIEDMRAHMFASFITWFNSCVNPIIYSFMNSNMRLQYKLLLIKFWNVIMRCLHMKEVNVRLGRTPSDRSMSSSRISRRELQ